MSSEFILEVKLSLPKLSVNLAVVAEAVTTLQFQLEHHSVQLNKGVINHFGLEI
jgi:ribosomal protein L9